MQCRNVCIEVSFFAKCLSNRHPIYHSALYDCNSGFSYRSEESSIEMSTKTMIESSICSATTVHTVTECTTVTVASTYTSSRSCASVEELTALATATCTTSSIATTVVHSTETVTKTVVLTSTSSSFPCKGISTLLVTALPTLAEDVGYVETAECAHFCVSQLFANMHVNHTSLSMTTSRNPFTNGLII